MTEVILLNPSVTDWGPPFIPPRSPNFAPKVSQRKLFVLIKSFSKGPSNPCSGSGDLMGRLSVAGIGFPWR